MNEMNVNTENGVMNIRVLDITPEYAAELLKLNTYNRRVKNNRINMYATDMINNNWKANGVPIVVGSDNVLKDGQHRLIACVKANKTLKNTILIRVPEKNSAFYDIGVGRSTTDTAALLGKNEKIFKSNKLMAIIRTCIEVEFSSRSSVISKPILIKEAEKNIAGLTFISNYIEGKNIKGIAVSGVWSAILNAFNSGYPFDKLEKFCNILVSGMTENREDFSIIALRNYLLSTSKFTGREALCDKFMRTQKMLYKYEKNIETTKCFAGKDVYYHYAFSEDVKDAIFGQK